MGKNYSQYGACLQFAILLHQVLDFSIQFSTLQSVFSLYPFLLHKLLHPFLLVVFPCNVLLLVLSHQLMMIVYLFQTFTSLHCLFVVLQPIIFNMLDMTMINQHLSSPYFPHYLFLSHSQIYHIFQALPMLKYLTLGIKLLYIDSLTVLLDGLNIRSYCTASANYFYYLLISIVYLIFIYFYLMIYFLLLLYFKRADRQLQKFDLFFVSYSILWRSLTIVLIVSLGWKLIFVLVRRLNQFFKVSEFLDKDNLYLVVEVYLILFFARDAVNANILKSQSQSNFFNVDSGFRVQDFAESNPFYKYGLVYQEVYISNKIIEVINISIYIKMFIQYSSCQ